MSTHLVVLKELAVMRALNNLPIPLWSAVLAAVSNLTKAQDQHHICEGVV